ncbi:protein sidekick-1-like [Orbicella faveolata]|uniref:protein sidekick-1-like n=1 Tax=Orbicella faveolata TaxID=48498 RepID=UPI0009E2DB07|nr:protein sidekick-1-like [Orbicella faveolata]
MVGVVFDTCVRLIKIHISAPTATKAILANYLPTHEQRLSHDLKIYFQRKCRLCIVPKYFCVISKCPLITTVVCFFTDPPDITVDPQNTAVTEGDNVTLSCNVDGNPAPSISWTTDGFQVNTTINSRISFSADKKQLTITKVKRTDNGNYRCVANNSLGNATSDAATVDVQYQPEITLHPENQTKSEGDNVTLSCNATGNPQPTISWTRNGFPVNTSNNSSISFSEDKKLLTITNVNRTDSGEYRCLANNSLGNETSDVARLDVQYPPDITVDPQNTAVTEGDNVTLSCNVDGNPAPSISWTTDGFQVNTTINSRISFSADKKQLTITKVKRTDNGNYRCVANNSLGNATSDAAALDVNFAVAPEVTIIGVQEQFVIEGRLLLLTCQYNALPPVSEVQWNKNGTVIARNDSVEINDSRVTIPHYNQSQVQLEINATTPQDAGNYTCLVVNDVGNSSDATSIIIQVKPHPPLNVSVHSKSSRVVVISWIAGFDGNSAIQNYAVKRSQDNEVFVDAVCQGSLSDSSCVVFNTSASFGNLLPWTTYYFKVFARNMVGISDGSSVVNATTDEEEPDGVPQNVRGQNSSSTSILVMWDEVPADQQNGVITGYTITYESQTEHDNGNVQVNDSVRQTELTNLKEYVNYNITVFASTVKGDGPASDPPIVVRTDQDKPDGAPQNVRGQNSSSTSILVMWDKVPADQQNGVITGYTITYQSQTENDNGNVLAGPDDRQKELINLKEYVNYNITVFASTVKGDGPASDPPIVVRTDQDTSSSMIDATPMCICPCNPTSTRSQSTSWLYHSTSSAIITSSTSDQSSSSIYILTTTATAALQNASLPYHSTSGAISTSSTSDQSSQFSDILTTTATNTTSASASLSSSVCYCPCSTTSSTSYMLSSENIMANFTQSMSPSATDSSSSVSLSYSSSRSAIVSESVSSSSSVTVSPSSSSSASLSDSSSRIIINMHC